MPVKLMLDDARRGGAPIALSGDPTCRNTVVVLVVGGGEGTTSGLSNAALAAAAADFLNVGGPAACRSTSSRSRRRPATWRGSRR